MAIRLASGGQMSTTKQIVPWRSSEALQIRASSPATIVEYAATQLSPRDRRSIVEAFQAESYEMVATFIWTKAASALKRQIASLGMAFVGELLNRPDLTEESDPSRSLSDHDAISLAEDLALISATQALRLSHSLELVSHFNRLDQAEGESEYMASEEAISLLKTCVSSILSQPHFEGADRFRAFRESLSSATLKREDFLSLLSSPYFFVRTTLSILLTLVKSERGAAQEHAIGNMASALPIVWENLRQPEKWQVGQAYAQVTADGNRAASSGLRAVLIKVHGFDFVPESLRSNSFTQAAAAVLSAHFGWNNFYNEEQPMMVLASMGSAIPRPAFANCMEAALAVWLGNRWGYSFGAESQANIIFRSLRQEQWDYYLNECLVGDKTILDKLAGDNNPCQRWITLADTYAFASRTIKDKQVRKLLDATSTGDLDDMHRAATQVRENLRK